MARQLRGFPPVIDENVTTLILGSFPSAASLKKKQYYGHPQNQFWKLVGRALGMPICEKPYEQRLAMLLANRIGLWDVVAECERPGSLDGSIRNARHNEFKQVMNVAESLRKVCFNGKIAAKLEPWFAEQGYETLILPSSSAANTVAFATKLESWRRIVC